MIPKELSDWLQVVGLFGVLGGLIFVGLQLRLDRQVALSSSVDQAAADRKVWAQLVAENTDVWRKGLLDEPLSANEAIQFEELAGVWELQHFSRWNRARQTISEQPPERWVREMGLELHRYPGLRKFWQLHVERMDRVGASTSWMGIVSEELERLDRNALE